MPLKKLRIMAPGPVEIPPEVGNVASLPIIHHRTQPFRVAMKDTLEALKRVVGTSNSVALLAASGTGAMEACVANLFAPGDEVIVGVCGNFGQRWADICEAFGLKVHKLEAEWGEPVGVEALGEVIKAQPQAKGVFATFNETSTGVENDIEAFGKLVEETSAVLIVDGVSGVGALPFHMDKWGVDALAIGSQKGFLIPPGLAFVGLSNKARERLKAGKFPRFYFSLSKAIKKIEDDPALPDTPYTPAVSLVLQLREALRLIEEDGLENVWARGARLGEATRAAIKAMGLKLLAARNFSNVVTAVDCRDGKVNPSKVTKSMLADYGISIPGGQGKLKGKIFRIGHVGHVDEIDVLGTIGALEMVLREQGAGVNLGAGVAAAQESFLKARSAGGAR